LFDLQPIQIFLFYLKIFTMKKIFTIVLVLSVFLSFGQRPQVSSSLDLQKSTFGVNQAPKTEVDTLIPGNWANATGFSVYWFSEAIGYVFGTNTYSDKAYGQQFSVDEPMELTGGIFWIAYADGTVGNVIFTVWDFVDGAPGAVLVSKAIPIADVVGSTTLANAITVYFDDPIVVEGDFVVGVDFSELEAYVPTTKRLGHVSSQIGMGGNLGLVWVKESDDGWFDVMGYTNPIDVDLGIFPFVVVQDTGPLARIQIIHNSADAAVEEVDIFVNGDLFLSDFAFRTATPFVNVPAGVDLDIIVAPAGAGIGSGVGPVTVNLTEGETYIAIANGIVSADGYDPATAFSLDVFPTGREAADVATNTDVLVFHGSTDAPTVSVWETGVGAGELFTFSYGEFAGYLELGTADYVLEVRTADGETTVVAYSAPLSTLGLNGAAITVVASGFLDPANNSNGEAFGLYVALASGGDLIPLPIIGDGFTVTFNVDMTAAEGFDPAEDHVFVTGNFTGWAQPGTEGSVQMQRVVDKSREVIYFQDFEGETFPPTGWAKINPDDGTGWKIVTSGTSPVPGWTSGTVTGSPDGGTKMAFCTWDTGGATANDQWLVSPKITVGEDYQLSFYLRLYTANYDDNVDILVSKGAQDVTGDFSITLANLAFTTGSSTEWTLYTYDLTAHAEINVDDEIYIAFREHVADNYDEGSAIFLDQVKITGTGGGGGDDLIYTATVNNIAEGELLYKYFSNAFGAGWDGGEWAGDPNRSFLVEANAVLNDIWGQQPNVSVDEIQLDMVTKVFPNPVRNTLYIQSQQNIDYLRLYDMAGRVVFQADVMDNQTTIDATQLGGGLYILQMVSGQQVKTHKIQVVK
jgi:hypothetical protein